MKKLIAIIAALMLATAPAMAQVFIMDEDEYNNGRAGTDANGFGVMVPEQDVTYDQYLPLGEGIVVLAGLAGAYLLGKRKKEN